MTPSVRSKFELILSSRNRLVDLSLYLARDLTSMCFPRILLKHTLSILFKNAHPFLSFKITNACDALRLQINQFTCPFHFQVTNARGFPFF